MSACGVSEPYCALLKHYLLNRVQYVSFNNFKSNLIKVGSGVPQGSILGPLLFVIFINDLVNSLTSCNVLAYADDIKIFSRVQSLEQATVLQRCLVQISDWATENKLTLNTNKCLCVSFTRKHQAYNFNYILNNVILTKSNSFCDLGVVFDSELTFSLHINTVVSKALKMLGFIFRTCKMLNSASALKSLYSAYVRSILEYASVVWCPLQLNQINQLERIQRRFTKFAFKMKFDVYPVRGHCYNDLLSVAGLDSLQLRRTKCSITFLFKLCNNLIDCPQLMSCVDLYVPARSLRKHLTFQIRTTRTNALHKYPLGQMFTNFASFCCASYIFCDSLCAILQCVNRDFVF